MSTGYLSATLMTITFIGLKFVMEGLYFLVLYLLAPDHPARTILLDFQKLFLSLSFLLPIVPFFFYYKWKSARGNPGPFTAPSRGFWFLWSNLAVVFLALPYAIQTLGTEIETLTRIVFPCDEKYKMMMEIFQPTGSVWDMLGAYLTIGIVGPLCEEFFFREILMSGLLQKKGARQIHAIILFQGTLFGLSHLNQWQIPYAIPMGILFGYVRLWTGSLKVPIVVHALNNLWAVATLYHFTDLSYYNSQECESLEHVPWYYLSAALLILLLSLVHLKNNSVFSAGGTENSGSPDGPADPPQQADRT